MYPMQPIKNLNSSEGYLSAIHYIRRIEKEVESAEQGNPSIGFQEQVQAVLDLQAVIKARTAEGGIPLHLHSVHHHLEEILQELSIRVETASRKLGVSSSQLSIEDEKGPLGRSVPWAKISLGGGLVGAAALFYGLFCPAKPTNDVPQPGTPQDSSSEGDGKTPDSSEEISEPVPEKWSDIAPQVQNSNQPDTIEPSSSAKSSESLPEKKPLNLKKWSDAGGCKPNGCPPPFFSSISNTHSPFPLPDFSSSQIGLTEPETIRNANPLTPSNLPISLIESFIDENFDEEKQTSTEVRNDGEGAQAFTIWHPDTLEQGAKSRTTYEKVNTNPIAGHVRDLTILVALFFARYALNSAAPLLCLAAAHRLDHLTGASKGLKELMSPLPYGLERSANLYSGFEAMLSVSTSEMLESMRSLDRWALVGFMEWVRNAPGVQGAVGPISFFSLKGLAWNLIKFSPFLVGNAPSWISSSKENVINLFLENTTRSDPADAKIMASYSRDLGYLAYIYLTGRGLNTAAPMLTVAAVYHANEIIRLCNVKEELRSRMPLFADGVEKFSARYEISGTLSFFLSNMLDSLTNMNAWAMVGLVELLTAYVPFFHSLHWKWKLFRFAPLLLAGVLPNIPFGHNFQALPR